MQPSELATTNDSIW